MPVLNCCKYNATEKSVCGVLTSTIKNKLAMLILVQNVGNVRQIMTSSNVKSMSATMAKTKQCKLQ